MAPRRPVQQHDLRSPDPPTSEGTVLLVVTEPLAPDDVNALCARASIEAAGRPRLIVCDVGTVHEPNVAMVDALARIALTARQSGCDVQVYRASPHLAALIGLVGLADVLPCQPRDDERARQRALLTGREGPPDESLVTVEPERRNR